MYVQNNVSLLADVFENFRNMSLKIYEVDPTKFLSTPGLAWQAAFKKTKVKLDLLTDIVKLLMEKKGIGQEYVTLSIDMQKLITNA